MFSNPRANVADLGLIPGMVVADFGAGVGNYALEMARTVGAGGKVYAIEVQKDLLERLAREAKSQHLLNLEVIWGNVEKPGGTKLKDQAVSVVVMANVLFQTDAKYSMALEAKRILRTGGRVVLIDWSGSFGGIGPRADQVVSKDEAKRIFAEAGLQLQAEFSAGEHHYGLIFIKS
jgi:ubiquinone/menaquinone biosynthesis C-methylase UbiE